MANKTQTTSVQAEEVKDAPKPVEKPKAPVYVTKYTAEELSDAAEKAFKTDKVIVRAALKMAGKETCTMEEAKRIVTEFKNKEVRN